MLTQSIETSFTRKQGLQNWNDKVVGFGYDGATVNQDNR
jgi:hypothetical protein